VEVKSKEVEAEKSTFSEGEEQKEAASAGKDVRSRLERRRREKWGVLGQPTVTSGLLWGIAEGKLRRMNFDRPWGVVEK